MRTRHAIPVYRLIACSCVGKVISYLHNPPLLPFPSPHPFRPSPSSTLPSIHHHHHHRIASWHQPKPTSYHTTTARLHPPLTALQARSDPNNTFMVGFKTPPSDSTGVGCPLSNPPPLATKNLLEDTDGLRRPP